MEVRRRGRSSAAICAEVLRAIDRIYRAEGPDEPDLGLNVAYVTARRTLERLAAAKAWVPPASVRWSIRARLRVVESITDPVRLETELLTFPTWAIRLLDRRGAERSNVARSTPRRRAGDRPQTRPQAG